MSSINRFTHLALGLVIGVGIALLFLVAAVPEFRDSGYRQQRQQDTADHRQRHDDVIPRPSLWSRYTTPQDTLAQWIMATLSIVATGFSIWAVLLVRGTLHETRRIGEAQVRAYLTFKPFRVTLNLVEDEKIEVRVFGEINNSGQSPATDIAAQFNIGTQK